MEGVGEPEVQEVFRILSGALSPDNTLRRQCESEYNSVLSQFPDRLILCLLLNLQGSDLSVRTLAALLLKKIVDPQAKQEIWAKLAPETHSACKKILLERITAEENKKIKEHICEVVGLLGSSILTTNIRGTWDELIPYLYHSLSAGGAQSWAALDVLTVLFPYLHEEFIKNSSQLLQFFKHCLGIGDISTRFSCLKAINALLSVVETGDALYFKDLVKDVLISVDYILTNDLYTGNKALETLRELAESEPKLFKPSFNYCFELIQQIYTKPQIDISTKNLVLDFVVTVVERMPKQLQAQLALGEQLLTRIMEMMVSIDLEVDESWARPDEGFQDKEDEDGSLDLDYAKVGRKLITRLLESVGDKFLLQPVLSLIQKALSTEGDWRLTYAALMTLSEIIQFVQEPEKIAEIVPIIGIKANSDHPKIRYATFHLIGQVCEDYENEFQASHHETIYPMLMKGLSDPVPRVVSHCLAAITNFFEGAGETLANQYIGQLMPKLIEFLTTPQHSIVIEHACTTIASAATVCKDFFKENFVSVVSYLISLLDKYQKDCYKTLRGRVIECITLMSVNVGKNIFAPHATKIIHIMRTLQEGDLENSDELVGYLLNGWQRICEVLGSDFCEFLDAVVPGLLRMVEKQMEISVSSTPDLFIDVQKAFAEEKKKSISTTITENKELAMHTLLSFVDTLKGGFAKYIEPAVRVALPMVNFKLNEDVRGAAAGLLAGIVEVQKNSGEPDAIQKSCEMAKAFIATLWEALEDEFVTETQVDQLNALKSIIEIPGIPYLSQEEVNQIGEKSLKLLDNSIKSRDIPNEDSDEEDDEEFTKFKKSEEDSLHTAISEVIGAIFKTHKDLSLSIVQFLILHVFPKFLTNESSDEDHKFVIFVIDDVIEFLGQGLVENSWNALGEALIKFAADPNDAVRQAACYGLGIYAVNSNVSTFQQWTGHILTVLEQAIRIPVGKRVKSHGHAKDNAIASIGRLIKYQHANLNLEAVIPAWIELLPLKWDKAEAVQVNELLADLALSSSHQGLTFGSNYERLPKIVHHFADILETKYINKDTTEKVKLLFTNLRNSQIPDLASIWGSLKEVQQAKVNRLLSS
ncbi:unnamed protein product [Blepharisma stoltei]|uniref:Uncharacterized protein n=1 Tax=Blepharisma stoltei TaxID=1481888 RepID=A0AAU9J606_9CILI|nr:unnamed protein product [Blepharisma stoltei]